jgi:Ca2+/H+ antiporter
LAISIIGEYFSTGLIGIISLPILANDAMAMQCAAKDQIDLAIQSALGKSIWTAHIVLPILVVGWGMRVEDMNFLFDDFQVSARLSQFYWHVSVFWMENQIGMSSQSLDV